MRCLSVRSVTRFVVVGVVTLALITILSHHISTNVNDAEYEDVRTWIRKESHRKEYIDRRGVHVIVGHYMDKDLPWDKTPNFTNDVLNTNGYSPVGTSGYDGQAVYPLSHEANKAKTLFHINKFNLLVSDRIPVNRTLPDVRKPACKNVTYDWKSLPDTSVIIVFHDEAWSTLFRTIHSVINRTPKSLLREIILVDDASNRKFLKHALEQDVAELEAPIKIIRTGKRSGLIRARLLGARAAVGQVITFLDAHCECTDGWIEPLLERIAGDRRRIVCPVIDIIHDETFAYVRSFELHWGAVNWQLHFRWLPVSRAELKKLPRLNGSFAPGPFKTPVMAGGLFAINRNYFYELGTYDDGMDIWGGENIELSFRAWQCGGSVEIHPCSHVGHLFRRSSPYSFPKGVGRVLYSNLARVAAVWMDEWANFYFMLNPEARKFSKNQNVQSRKSLRKRLGCKSFQWYLENIWPENIFPMSNRFFGRIKNLKTGKCFVRPSSASFHQPVGKIVLEECAKNHYSSQYFVMTPSGTIVSDESVCLDSPEEASGTAVIMMACSQVARQQWTYHPKTRAIVHKTSKLCLDLGDGSLTNTVTLERCDESLAQQWTLHSVDWTKTLPSEYSTIK